jgi:hypothetical protein
MEAIKRVVYVTCYTMEELEEGSCKGQVKRPCHGCSRKGDDVPNPARYRNGAMRCYMNKPDSWKVLHHDMDTLRT